MAARTTPRCGARVPGRKLGTSNADAPASSLADAGDDANTAAGRLTVAERFTLAGRYGSTRGHGDANSTPLTRRGCGHDLGGWPIRRWSCPVHRGGRSNDRLGVDETRTMAIELEVGVAARAPVNDRKLAKPAQTRVLAVATWTLHRGAPDPGARDSLTEPMLFRDDGLRSGFQSEVLGAREKRSAK